MRPLNRLVIVVLACSIAPAAARAADLAVSVRTAAGQPVADAVVTVTARSAGPIRFPWAYRMAQHNLQFDPFVLVAPVGAEVAFPNLDTVRHHVYSFSAAHPFELKLYGHDETRFVRFERPGVIALGCNIHDAMVAFILVVDTPFAAKTDASGVALIRGLPAGPVSYRVWHPYLKAPGNEVGGAAAAGRAAVTVALRRPPQRHRMY